MCVGVYENLKHFKKLVLCHNVSEMLLDANKKQEAMKP